MISIDPPYNEDYLRELELWPLFEMRQASTNLSKAAAVQTVPSTTRGVTRAGVNEATRLQPPSTPVRQAESPSRSPSPSPFTPRAATHPISAPATASPHGSDPAQIARIARIALLDWDGLKAEAAACEACKLCRQRKQAVLGVGAASAPWLFVGEGPGAEEDDQGEPFVGPAGQLLDAMLAATGLQRGREVYLANVVKCRPPGNRNPSDDEALACAPLLDRQIDLIQPKIIVALGKIALNRLTGSDASVASMRGKMHAYRGIPVLATYHPAYLLRNLPDKLKAWEDLMFAKKAMAGMSALESVK